MLVSGPSLPVLRYLWSSLRSRKPLLRHRQFAPESLLRTLSPGPHGAMGQCTGTCALGVGTSGYHPRSPEYVSRYSMLGRAMPTRQPTEESFETTQLLRVLTALRKGDFPVRSIRSIRRFSYLPIIAVAAKAMPGDKDCRTPWRHSLGGVDLWRRLNANSYMVKLVHFARLRHALELLVRYWFSVVILPQRRSP
jgi:hypothetical protein